MAINNVLSDKLWHTYGLLFLLGVIAATALPPLNWWPVLFLVLTGVQFLLARSRETRFTRWFWPGYFLGLGYFIAALHWIGFAFLVDADAFLWMMPFAVGGLAAFLAVYWGLASLAARFLEGKLRVPMFAGLPFTLFVAELLRGALFTGFPWAAPGQVADGMGGVLQLASLIGMPGLTFLVLLWGGLPFALWRCRKSPARLTVLVVVMSALPLSWFWGNQRLAHVPQEPSPAVQVRLVQPNISQSDKWRSENAEAIFEALLALSRTSSESERRLVIWPESAVPFLLDESADALAEIDLVLSPGQALLAGSIRRQQQPSTCPDCVEPYFTSVLAIDDSGKVIGTYDKWRLVPGGEFLPLAWLLEPLGFRNLASVPESFTAGRGPQSLYVPGFGAIGPLICYEIIFPDRLVDESNRPELLVNITNDGWFGKSTGPYQHFAQARMRAVEHGIAVARAANTGISGVIDPMGRVLASMGLEQEGFLDVNVPQRLPDTVFLRFGLWPAWLVGLFVVAILSCRWHFW